MDWELSLLFFGVAAFYASVGFGGGSSYLAILAAWDLPYLALRPIALLCNLVVVSGNLWVFERKGFLRWKKVLPLVAVSVPFAFWGGTIRLSQPVFFIVLGFTLLSAALFLLLQKPDVAAERDLPWYGNLGLGAGIGFVSGLVGIGGGIFLAPLLHLAGWDRPRVIAATASAFIFVNSLAGLAGQAASQNLWLNWQATGSLLLAVLLGGQVGSRLSVRWLSPVWIRRLTAVLVAYVAIRLLIKYLA